MPTPLKVLIVEDNLLDAELMLAELRSAGYEPEWQRVDTEADYVARLHEGLDLVLSDFQMPLFNGLRALELLKASAMDVPFILVSGTIGEDVAVAAIKTGASDYLLKDRLVRLGPAVQRALEQNRLQQESRRTDQTLRDNAVFIHEVLNSLTSAVVVLDEAGNITATNETWRRFGRENGGREFLNENYLLVCATSVQRTGNTDAQLAHDGIRSVLDGNTGEFSMEYPCHSPTEQRWFLMHVSPLGGAKRGAVIAHENITERKRAEETRRESEERFSGAFEYAPIGMALVAPEGPWLKVNRALCDLVGYAEAELLTRTFQDITHPGISQLIWNASAK